MLLPQVPSSSSLRKGLYNPKAFVTHAALLGQACAHCPKFLTAASRRSLGRVSVPVWPVALSGRLPVIALVGHYPTNKLIGRESIPHRKTFHTVQMPVCVISGISPGFPELSQSEGQVTHVLLTRSPLITRKQAPQVTVRLACVKHAASVRPEPGSNSPLMFATHSPERPRENRPRRVKNPAETEPSPLDLISINQPKEIRPTSEDAGTR